MAKCDEGYLCDVCGEEVEGILNSDLYLRYIIGEVSAEQLTAAPERHILCNPIQAQFIIDENFPPVIVDGIFSKHELDAESVREKEELITRGWKRLQEVTMEGVPFTEYPLAEFRESSE